jgi:hypothetical protein
MGYSERPVRKNRDLYGHYVLDCLTRTGRTTSFCMDY